MQINLSNFNAFNRNFQQNVVPQFDYAMAMQTQRFIHISIVRILIHVYAWMRTFIRRHIQLMEKEKKDFISFNFIFIIIIIEMLSFHIKIVFLIRILMIFFSSHGGKSNWGGNNISSIPAFLR